MRLSLQFQDESLGYAYFDTGKAGLELMTRDGFAEAVGEVSLVPEPQDRRVVLDFRVDDVDATYAELLAQGVNVVAPPQDRPLWRARTAHIADPDGHVVELYTSLPDNALPTT